MGHWPGTLVGWQGQTHRSDSGYAATRTRGTNHTSHQAGMDQPVSSGLLEAASIRNLTDLFSKTFGKNRSLCVSVSHTWCWISNTETTATRKKSLIAARCVGNVTTHDVTHTSWLVADKN
jgi:hypothetical protein